MDNPPPDRPPDRNPAPANILSYRGPTPANMLSYPGAAPRMNVQHVVYERDGDTLTITIPPPPFSTPIIVNSLVLLACALPIAGIVLFVISEYPYVGFRWNIGGFFCLATGGVLPVLWAIGALRRLIYWTREGKWPSVVRIDAHGLEIRATGSAEPVIHYFRRDRITELNIHPGTGWNPRLFLQIVTVDDEMYLASVPWCAGQPMIEVEEKLRDVLGLPPMDRR